MILIKSMSAFRETILQYNESMRGLALIALALTLGYAQCVAACTMESRQFPPNQPAGHCHQHPDSRDTPRSPEVCGHHSAVELNVSAAVFPVAFFMAHTNFEAPQLQTVFAGALLEVPASPPGLVSPIVPLRI